MIVEQQEFLYKTIVIFIIYTFYNFELLYWMYYFVWNEYFRTQVGINKTVFKNIHFIIDKNFNNLNNYFFQNNPKNKSKVAFGDLKDIKNMYF